MNINAPDTITATIEVDIFVHKRNGCVFALVDHNSIVTVYAQGATIEFGWREGKMLLYD